MKARGNSLRYSKNPGSNSVTGSIAPRQNRPLCRRGRRIAEFHTLQVRQGPVDNSVRNLAAVKRRASPLRFPERRPAAGPLFPRAKPSPETRYGPFQQVPGRVDVAVNLDLAMRASFWMRTGQVFWDRAAELRAMLRGVPRVDHRKPATGPWPQPRRNGKGGNFGAVSPEGEPFGRPGTASLSLPKLKLHHRVGVA